MQIILSSPEITCDHCIATIQGVIEATTGAAFISGDPDHRTFIVEVGSGAVLDVLAAALAAEGYPLGDVPEAADDHVSTKTPDWRPADYRIVRTDAGANVNYDCYCGCDAGFALDRSQADPATESCCCGNHILVGAGAGERIASKLDAGSRYRIDVQTVAMPWGQPLEVALAIPEDD
ncbi:MAG: heavy-metal-associated domain-containing protein [Chloroflexi bacterium]|nr:heavy-metal-associated domain-containing protein [Chloroflexota bacterium]MDA1240298.1 heavy-metal-associated domain-containing protein [Chloroflexota bacterium]